MQNRGQLPAPGVLNQHACDGLAVVIPTDRFSFLYLLKLLIITSVFFLTSSPFSWADLPSFQGDVTQKFSGFKKDVGNLPLKIVSLDTPDQKRMNEVSIPNLGIVEKGVFRGAQPKNIEDYRTLSQIMGISILVNLRFKKDNPNFCLATGLQCLDFPMKASYLRSRDKKSFKNAFRFVVRALKSGKKVYIHCRFGADRTGALAAALMVRENACGRNFNQDDLWQSVKKTLYQHHFHRVFLRLLFAIHGWVFHLEKNEWLCQ